MAELTLHSADAATASRLPALAGTRRAVGARIDAIGVGQYAGGREVLPVSRPTSLGRYGHRREIGATTLGANLERSWRRRNGRPARERSTG